MRKKCDEGQHRRRQDVSARDVAHAVARVTEVGDKPLVGIAYAAELPPGDDHRSDEQRNKGEAADRQPAVAVRDHFTFSSRTARTPMWSEGQRVWPSPISTGLLSQSDASVTFTVTSSPASTKM